MVKKLHIGNLAYSVSDESLKNIFSQFGTVESAIVVKDKDTGRSKGFGFVEMSTDQEADDAVEKLNKYELEGRTIFVSESHSTGKSNFNHKKRPGGNKSFGKFGRKKCVGE